MTHIIEVNNLKKSYGNVNAVKGISFYVEKGKLFAFLGPNGAGKSTTIDMICTFLKPDAGEVMVNGHRLGKQDHEIRKSIGVVFQDSLLDKQLTVEENLSCRGALYGLGGRRLAEAVHKAMSAVSVTEYAGRQYGKLSGGQRRRCDIARALIHTPQILFLDEPTTGLDPQTRKSVWETIRKLKEETGMTVFLTTHYMEEALDADYCLIIDDGRIAARGTPSYLRETYTSDRLIMTFPDAAASSAAVPALKEAGFTYTVRSEQIVVRLKNSFDALPLLQKYRELLTTFEVVHGTMDDAFIEITGKELRQ